MTIARDYAGTLCLGGVSLADLASEAGTPVYAYDLDAVQAEAKALRAAFDGAPHLVAYALKANTAGGIVRALATEGCGADVVSGAELLVALGCGILPERIVYSGVAKTDGELDRAIACGASGVAAVQIESIEEIARVEARARAAGRVARVSVRINPGVDLKDATHAHIATGHERAKFGVSLEDVARTVQTIEASARLKLVGMASHVGSQFTDTAPYVQAARVLFGLVRGLRDAGHGRALSFVDAGGGFGVDYGGARSAPRPADFVRAVRLEQSDHGLGDLALYVEPGRSLVAPYGVIVASVVQVKVAAAVRWLMIDAGMNDLLRPALYQAHHRIVPIEREVVAAEAIPWQVVGPVCESSDNFGEHSLPREPPRAVAILDAGAYGYTMASQYNGRQLPVEAFIRGGRVVSRTERAKVEVWAAERARAGL